MEYKQIICELNHMPSGLTREQTEALEEAADIISDYEIVARQNAGYIEKYEMAAVPVKGAEDTFQCPACMKRIAFRHTHCHWCGKKMGWEDVWR